MTAGEKMNIKNQKGASAVEFALVLPLLIVLLFGIIEFGLILYDKAVVTNASREGARYGIVYREPGSEITCDNITNIIQTYTAGKLITFGSVNNVAISYAPGDCNPGSGNDLTVTVSYQYDYLLLPGFVAGLVGPIDLDGQTIMVKE